jgi:hypothetical protein
LSNHPHLVCSVAPASTYDHCDMTELDASKKAGRAFTQKVLGAQDSHR